ADGSNSEQCGNGARCIAAWLVREGSAQGDAFVIDSPLASHEVKVLGEGQFAVTMGVPAFEPANVPLMGFAHAREEYLLP
ncbi:diaminopimelate epimerase family protein, partial [Bifidobacterium longum subsp. longum ATCC 55813]